jgi:membrane protein
VQLSSLMPAPAFNLLAARIHDLAHHNRQTLSVNLVVSFILTFWSSATGTKAILGAIGIAYRAQRHGSFLRVQLIGLSMTLVGVLCAVLAICVLLVLPQVFAFLGLSHYRTMLVHGAGIVMLLGLFFLAVTLLYRFGPASTRPQAPRIGAGALLATLLWVAASEAVSAYVRHLGTLNTLYGPLAAVAVIMLWFYVSAYATLLGAELNASLESGALVSPQGRW